MIAREFGTEMLNYRTVWKFFILNQNLELDESDCIHIIYSFNEKYFRQFETVPTPFEFFQELERFLTEYRQEEKEQMSEDEDVKKNLF